MIERKFDSKLPYKCVVYGRMSDDKQNPRSPDQQFDVIDREIASRHLHWSVLKRYRDDGISGRYFRKRAGLQEMLRDIRTGKVRVDLLLLDTRERLGRIQELGAIRKELLQEHGVFILTADSGFADPTSPGGRILAVFDEERATQENRVKSHQVTRGKIDAVMRKFWPGGPPPVGFKLENVFVELKGRQEKAGSVLVHDPSLAWFPRRVFERAAETGHGQTRLARFFNGCPDIPKSLKPISGSSIGHLLDNRIYCGDFHFRKLSTDIVDDVLIREKNEPGDILVVNDFCEPIVTRELWTRVQAIRNIRRELIKGSRGNGEQTDKYVQPLAPGISIVNLLSGLVRCGHCGAAMRPVGPSRRKDPTGKYVYFSCPRSIDGTCCNKKTISVNWLTDVVVERVKASLFNDV